LGFDSTQHINRRIIMKGKGKFIITRAALLSACLFTTATVQAGELSKANLHWFWETGPSVGQTELERSSEGLKARVKINANQLPGDHVMTLWFIVFNAPENCLGSPCGVADLDNPLTAWDFLYGGGIVTTPYKADFGGKLAANETSGSGFVEFGLPQAALGVTDPEGAEVLLAIHSHGPAGSGAFLAHQISSYLGGCAVFLGPGGFASSPDDVPSETGQCSTVMYAIHQP
jgi:hypothetical protein